MNPLASRSNSFFGLTHFSRLHDHLLLNLAIFQLAACGLFQKNSLEQCSAEEINLLSSLRSTPLHYAIVGENEETVRYLVLRGALVNTTNIYAESPLHWACKVGNLAIVRTLLQHKACPHAVDADGDRKSTRLNSSHVSQSRMPSSA